MKNLSRTRTILLAWLVAGTLDLADAILFSHVYGIPAARVLRYIASGLWSGAAKSPNAPLLGIAIHYTIALAWTVLYVFAARAWPALRRHALLAGAVYGLLIFFVMNYGVLPHSRIGHAPHFKTPNLINAVLALVLCIGLPIALIDRRTSR